MENNLTFLSRSFAGQYSLRNDYCDVLPQFDYERTGLTGVAQLVVQTDQSVAQSRSLLCTYRARVWTKLIF